MTSGNLGALTESLARLQELADTLSGTTAAVSTDVSDDTGQLTITLTEGRITGLRLRPQWKDQIPPQSLGDQILILTMKPFFDRLRVALDDGAPAPKSPPDVAPMRWRFPNQETRDRLATEVRSAAHEVDRLTEAGVTPEPRPQQEFTSRNRLVTATMTEGALTNLSYDDAVESAALQTIVDSTLEALELAYDAPPAAVEPPSTELGAAMERIRALQAEAADYRIR